LKYFSYEYNKKNIYVVKDVGDYSDLYFKSCPEFGHGPGHDLADVVEAGRLD